MGTAGDDFWYSMKNPPYPSPVPSPERTLPERNKQPNKTTKTNKNPATKDGVKQKLLVNRKLRSQRMHLGTYCRQVGFVVRVVQHVGN